MKYINKLDNDVYFFINYFIQYFYFKYNLYKYKYIILWNIKINNVYYNINYIFCSVCKSVLMYENDRRLLLVIGYYEFCFSFFF